MLRSLTPVTLRFARVINPDAHLRHMSKVVAVQLLVASQIVRFSRIIHFASKQVYRESARFVSTEDIARAIC